MTDEAKVEIAASAQIGESPVWDERSGVLWWVDSAAPAIHRYDPATGVDEHKTLPDEVGCVALTEGRELVLAMANGFHRYDWVSEQLTLLGVADDEPAANRFNDGRVDRTGVLWAGTMAPYGDGPTGALYRLGAHGVQQRATGLSLSNALCWNLAGDTMFHADTMTGLVWRRAVDAHGDVSAPEVFIDFNADPDLPGLPDGAIVDSEDHVWIAHYGGGRVTRFSPAGTVVETRNLPTAYATCPALGGPDRRTLFVTTAGSGAIAEGITDPDFAALYSFRVDVAGVPEVPATVLPSPTE